jgi:hypothetical protein
MIGRFLCRDGDQAHSCRSIGRIVVTRDGEKSAHQHEGLIPPPSTQPAAVTNIEDGSKKLV